VVIWCTVEHTHTLSSNKKKIANTCLRRVSQVAPADVAVLGALEAAACAAAADAADPTVVVVDDGTGDAVDESGKPADVVLIAACV